MTVSELLDRVSSHEITEWRALFELEAEEHERDRRSTSQPKQAARRPTLGDKAGIADAITAAREKQGLDS